MAVEPALKMMTFADLVETAAEDYRLGKTVLVITAVVATSEVCCCVRPCAEDKVIQAYDGE